MKNLIILSAIQLTSIMLNAQTPQEFKPPFQYGKYVHFDKDIRDVSTSHPYVTYADKFNYRDNQNSYSNYAKVNYYIKYGRNNCTNEHNKLVKPFVFVEGISFDKENIRQGAYTLIDYFQDNINTNPDKPNTQVITNALNNFNAVTWGNHVNPTVGYSTFNWATLVTGIETIGINKTNLFHILQALEFPQKTWILFSYNHIKNKSHSL
jgi:hypothetical protein